MVNMVSPDSYRVRVDPASVAALRARTTMRRLALLATAFLCGASARAATVEMVATRNGFASYHNSVTQSWHTKSYHVSTGNIIDIGAVFSNYYNSDGVGERNNGASITNVHAYVEYPVGICTTLTVGGLNTGATVPAGTDLTTDLAPINIPAGAAFWIHYYGLNANGAFFSNVYDPANGDKTYTSTTNIADAGCAPPPFHTTGPSEAIHPTMIIGIVSGSPSPSVGIIGDSVAWGHGDVPNAAAANTPLGTQVDYRFGIPGRGMPANTAFICLCGSGMEVDHWINHTAADVPARSLLTRYFTTIVYQLGNNDIHSLNDSVSRLEAANATWVAKFAPPGVNIIGMTLLSNPKSTDGWYTSSNQTIDVHQSVINAYNADVLIGRALPLQQGFIDAIGPLQTNNKWNLCPGARSINDLYVNDGFYSKKPTQLYSVTANFSGTSYVIGAGDIGCGIYITGVTFATQNYINTSTNSLTGSTYRNGSIVLGVVANIGTLSADGIHPNPAADLMWANTNPVPASMLK